MGWVSGAVLLVAALAGLFGAGPLSTATAVSEDGSLQVDYERFAHRGGQTGLSITVEDVETEAVGLLVDAGYLESMAVEGITPEPDSITVTDGRLAFEFLRQEPLQQMRVEFRLTVNAMGFEEAGIRLGNGQAVRIRQFFYP